jgi:uncharacterized protein YndB with AHSA1/START domain
MRPLLITTRWGAAILILASLLVVTARAEIPADSGTGSQVTEGFVNAPVAETWRLFTTADGYKLMGANKAEVTLQVGGLIRSHGDSRGVLGDPETTVSEILAYDPQHLLVIRPQQAPASFGYRDAIDGTWTVIYFTASGQDMSFVRMVSLGYRDTPQSQALRQAVGDAHRQLLDRIARHYWPKCKLCAAETPAGAQE